MTTSRPLPRPIQELRQIAWRLLQAQSIVMITAAILFSLQNRAAGMSALCGGVIAVLGQGYFTLQALRYVGARQSSNIVRSFYKGAVGKWILTIVLFACAYVWLPNINSLVMFLTYGLVISVHLLIPWLEAKPEN